MPFKPNGFLRNERLQTKKDFEAVYSGKRIKGNFFILHYCYVDGIVSRKVAFTVSKKVSKLAVTRNKLKRRLREVYRLNRDILPKGICVIIRSLPNAVEADYREIRKEIIRLFTSVVSKKHSH